jgi:MYXO-CTERM domain-containing protein
MPGLLVPRDSDRQLRYPLGDPGIGSSVPSAPPVHHRVRLALTCVVLAFIASVFLGVRPTWARADGDPASDVLLAEDVFYPYQPRVSPPLEAALGKTLRAAARADGLHLKVAIIGKAEELGLVPDFFGHPQAYAQFLDREISFNQPQQLLVVMPAGFGVMPTSAAGALTHVPIYRQRRSDGLTRSAILAVAALAGHRGHAIAIPSTKPSSSGNSPPALLVFGLPAALLALAGLAAMRRRSSRVGEHPSDDAEN